MNANTFSRQASCSAKKKVSTPLRYLRIFNICVVEVMHGVMGGPATTPYSFSKLSYEIVSMFWICPRHWGRSSDQCRKGPLPRDGLYYQGKHNK